jgi:iron complex outermembrane recepter protein
MSRMRLLATTALTLSALTVPAAAQSQDNSGGVETVVVTGTNISGVAPVGSEQVTIDLDKALDTGATNLNDVIAKLPQVSQLGSPNGTLREGGTAAYGTPAGGGGNNVQGTSINLRGIGAQATLILVDGHRLALSGTQATYTDANQIPLAALQRIEIVADGNSAIYGSDAVGGVVNYVMRKDYDGLQAGARGTFVDGYDEFGISVVAGRSWTLGGLGAGNLVLSYDYDHRDHMLGNVHPFMTNVLTQYGGYDRRILGTNGAVNGGVGPNQTSNQIIPGALTDVAYCSNYFFGFPPFLPASCAPPGGAASYVFYSVPAGTGIPTTAQLNPTPTMHDPAGDTDYLGRMWRHQVTAFLNQEITPWLSFYVESFYTNRDTYSLGDEYGSPFNLNVTINPGSPYYIAPPASPPGYTIAGPEYVAYNFAAHGAPNWSTDNPSETLTVITGFKAQLPGGWNADLSFDDGINHACGVCQIGNNVDAGAFQHQVDIGAINPYSTAPLTDAQKAAILGSNIQFSHMIVQDVLLKFDGPLFELPGGTVKVAVGAEYYFNKEHLQNGANRSPGEQGAYAPVPPGYNVFEWDNNTNLSRTVKSGFAEIFIPLVGDANAFPLARSLNIDAAVRYDDYSDAGETTNPKVGVTWQPIDDLKIRGSWGTSFRAPALTDINPFVFSVKIAVPGFVNFSGNPDYGPMFGTNVGYLSGAQTGLKPETATNWSTGFDFMPHWLDGLRLSGTYYNIDYANQIVFPPVFPGALLNPAVAQQYGAYIHPVPANPGCSSAANYNASQQAFAAAVGIYGNPTVAQICSLNVWLDGRETNAASTKEDGFDLSAEYAFQSSIGNWDIGADVTRTLSQDEQAVAGGPVVSDLGLIGFLVRWRGRGSISWNRDGWGANLFVNYVGPYFNNVPTAGTPQKEISDWTTFDASVNYVFDDTLWDGFKGARVQVSAQNLFDRSPPVVLTAGYAGFDANNANPLGRIVSLTLTKDF